MSRLGVIFTIAFLASCSWLPEGGPKYSAIIENARSNENPQGNYDLIRLDANIAKYTQTINTRSLDTGFILTSALDPFILLRGDIVNISIWEPIGIGLFQPTGGRADLSGLVVDDRGEIYVPFVGTLKAEGVDISELRARIERELLRQTASPQVLVNYQGSKGRNIVIQGDIAKPGQYSLAQGALRLLDLLALAGGATSQARITEVVLRRGRISSSAWLDDIYGDPALNVALLPGDLIFLNTRPLTFKAMGVVKSTGEISTDNRNVSLLTALNLAGSFADLRADVTGVFVFRQTPDYAPGGDEWHNLENTSPTLVPARAEKVAYMLDMAEPDSFFIAQQFQIRDNDALYITNAPADEWRKVLSIVFPTLALPSTIMSPASAGTALMP